MKAMYAGFCDVCNGPIHVGEDIAADRRHGYSHRACLGVTDE